MQVVIGTVGKMLLTQTNTGTGRFLALKTRLSWCVWLNQVDIDQPEIPDP